MADGSLARRYARALIAIGTEENCIDQLGADLVAFAAVLELGEGALQQTLSNPGVTQAERVAVIGDVLGKLSLQNSTDSKVCLV